MILLLSRQYLCSVCLLLSLSNESMEKEVFNLVPYARVRNSL